MLSANFQTHKFEYLAKQLNINPRNKQDLQNIRFYPKVVEALNKTNQQYNKVDNLGYEHMSEEAYQNWLNSLKEAKQKSESGEIKKTFQLKVKLKSKIFKD